MPIPSAIHTAIQVVRLTPPGRGAVATLLVEGPGAAELIERQTCTKTGRALRHRAADRLVFGHFRSPQGEEIVVRRRSDESVELHCHGGQAAVAMIECALVEQGCRAVAWQAWAGRHHADPIAAAAGRALAEARTHRTAAILLDQYQGALRLAIDRIDAALHSGERAVARRQLEELLSRAELGRHLVRPWRVVLAGRPNVGKSSLTNALLGYPRALVHHTPGTTRDVVTATAAVEGWPVEWCDTAGLRAAESGIEEAGVALARQELAAADLVVLVFDASERWSAADQALIESVTDGSVARPSSVDALGATAGLSSSAGDTAGQANRGARPSSPVGALVVHNKCDLPAADGPRPGGLAVSAATGQGIDALLHAIATRLVPDPPPPGSAVPFTGEQVADLRELVGRSTGGQSDQP